MPASSEPSEQDFEFETVTVDEQGQVVRSETQHAHRFAEALPTGVTLEMVAIPGGSFLMGSRAGDGYPDEHPQHSVRVQPFFLGRHTVTQEEWQATMGWLPRCRGLGAKRPVDRASWHDALEFCKRLSQKTGHAYRLPSEAEWEYACRAGTATPFHCGRSITTGMANYVGEHIYLREPKGVYRHGSTVVGSFPANAFGLCDMHGNVWEWCADVWHDDYVGAPADGSVWESRATSERILRGGCWHDPPGLCRSAARLKHVPHEGEDFFGFRVAVTSLVPAPTDSSSRGNIHQPMRPATSMGCRIRKWLRR